MTRPRENNNDDINSKPFSLISNYEFRRRKNNFNHNLQEYLGKNDISYSNK